MQCVLVAALAGGTCDGIFFATNNTDGTFVLALVLLEEPTQIHEHTA